MGNLNYAQFEKLWVTILNYVHSILNYVHSILNYVHSILNYVHSILNYVHSCYLIILMDCGFIYIRLGDIIRIFFRYYYAYFLYKY